MRELCACGTRFATGLLRCPRCKRIAPSFTDRMKEEKEMPRITVAGGPSNAGAAPGEVGYIEPEHAAVHVEIRGEHGPELEGLPEGAAVIPDDAWASKPLAHLREAAKERRLSAAGSKADLAARLTEHDDAQAAIEHVQAVVEPEEVSA